MGPRLDHKKSRTGCVRCKSRKVKCTEERPSCMACLRHSVPCHYPQDLATTFSSGSTSFISPASPYSLKDDIDALDSELFHRRLLELQLLHHYVTVFARTLPASKSDTLNIKSRDIRELYAVDIVQVAFKYPFLLNTVFSISALHKTQPHPEALTTASKGVTAAAETIDLSGMPAKALVPTAAEAAEYARAHRIYLNLAIKQQREALIDLGPKNANAICLTSVLLAFIALKILPEQPNLEYEPPVQWLTMAHAIGTVMRASRPFLLPDDTIRTLVGSDPDFLNQEAIFNPVYIPQFQAILDYQDPGNVPPGEEEDLAYGRAISYMSAIHRAIQNQDPYSQIARRIMSTGPILPAVFIDLVAQRRPKALVILAYIMCMAKHVEDYWFFRGTAEHEVYGIQSTLPSEWQWAMEWPLSMLETLAKS